MHRIGVRVLFTITFVVFSILTAFPSQVSAQNSTVTGTVSAGTVNIRATPSLEGKSIGLAKKGDTFTVTGKSRGSNRIWYRVVLPSGGEGWISERVLNLNTSPDNVIWIGDSNEEEEVPLVMDCGTRQPILYVGVFAVVTKNAGLPITSEPGLGKTQIDRVKYNELFKVVDGPFCTRLSKFAYHIEWLVETGKGVEGYLLEGVPQGTEGYIPYTAVSKTDSSNRQTNRPAKISDEDIETVSAIFQSIAKYEIYREDAAAQLEQFVEDNDKDTLAWIVRRIPVYNVSEGRWESFARYTNFTSMKFRADSQLDLDPVNTTLDIVYGDYASVDEVWMMIGCGG